MIVSQFEFHTLLLPLEVRNFAKVSLKKWKVRTIFQRTGKLSHLYKTAKREGAISRSDATKGMI